MLSLILLPIMAIFIGIISAMLGIGGGAFIVPMHLSIATSMFIMVFTSIFETLTNLWLGQVRLDYAVLLAAGVIFGAQIGAHIAAMVSARNLRRIFRRDPDIDEHKDASQIHRYDALKIILLALNIRSSALSSRALPHIP